MSAEPKFFRNAAVWQKWLEKNHDRKPEVFVGFHKVKTGKPSITHRQALDEALCFGWIDGVARGGDETWHIRFTPRRAKSVWSAVNIKRVEELKAEGRMHAAGIAAYEARDPKLQNRYSSENRHAAALLPDDEKKFRANRTAWENFSAFPPSYRRPAIWWVVSAKKEETRQRRLATLIKDSEAGRRVPPLTPPAKRK
ncbi:MAG: YdeI/OmpD-associated family protein [Propylenella sp.]